MNALQEIQSAECQFINMDDCMLLALVCYIFPGSPYYPYMKKHTYHQPWPEHPMHSTGQCGLHSRMHYHSDNSKKKNKKKMKNNLNYIRM